MIAPNHLVNFYHINIEPTISKISQALQQLVNKVALDILIPIFASYRLFYLQQNLFILGFAVGFIFDQQTQAISRKVDIVYQAKRTKLEHYLIFSGGTFLAIFINMPTSLIIATLYYSAQAGALLYTYSEKRLNSKNENSLS